MNKILKYFINKKWVRENHTLLNVINNNDFTVKVVLSPYSEKHPVDISSKNDFIENEYNKEFKIDFYNKKYTFINIIVTKKGSRKQLMNKSVEIRNGKEEIIVCQT